MREYRDWRVWVRLSKRAYPYAEELLSNEVFVLVSAIAMNALLAFFPFVILLVSFASRFFPSWEVHTMTYEIVREYLPFTAENQNFVIDTLRALTSRFGQVQIVSFIILIWSIANVFVPLEMALNRAWGVTQSRGFWKSQQLALLMVVLSGAAAFLFIAGAAFSKYYLVDLLFGPDWIRTRAVLQFFIIKFWMIPLTLVMFYLIYYLVPNTTVARREVLVAAAFTGLLWEGAKYAFLLLVPLLGLEEIYGGFRVTVTLMTWAYISGIILLLGAHLTAKRVFSAQTAVAELNEGAQNP
jgi:membrane protein/epoxyqueuosine reductase